jgi:hypothetical protein
VLSIDRATLNRKIEADPPFAARLFRAIAMFLAIRMRSTVARFGYGGIRSTAPEEIDTDLMEKLHLAAARFDRMLKELMMAASD